MLRLDLARLGREGSLEVSARIPPDDPLWEDFEVTLHDAVEVNLRAMLAGTGQVVVRGSVQAELEQDCRRCLEPVRGKLDEEVTMVFVSSEDAGAEEDDEARVFDAGAPELDLSVPVLEEVVLAIDPYVVCEPECKGLCPRCGVNLNTDSCTCTTEEADPRWDALRALQKE